MRSGYLLRTLSRFTTARISRFAFRPVGGTRRENAQTFIVLVVTLALLHNTCQRNTFKQGLHYFTNVSQRPEGFYVVSLENVAGSDRRNSGRLTSFLERSQKMCGAASPEWIVIDGQLSKRRGAGLTSAFITILQHALQHAFSTAYIFEDDALMLNPLLCSARFRRALEREEPPNTFLTVFAGHHVVEQGTTKTESFVFTSIRRNFGSYAWAVRRENYKDLLSYWNSALENSTNPLSPDVDFTRVVSTKTTRLLRIPQLFTHPSGYSNTWSRLREEVIDKEKISLIIVDTTSSSLLEYSRFATWSDVLEEIIVQAPNKSHAASYQYRKDAQVPMRVVVRDAQENQSNYFAFIQDASSSVIVVMSSTQHMDLNELHELRASFLHHPYSVTTVGVTSQTKQGPVFQEPYVTILQKRFAGNLACVGVGTSTACTNITHNIEHLRKAVGDLLGAHQPIFLNVSTAARADRTAICTCVHELCTEYMNSAQSK